MQAVVWKGEKDVSVEEVSKPIIKDPRDAIIKVMTAAICGSDLHMYKNTMQGMHPGDILGHECMGIVDEVGTAVRDRLEVGQRVVVSAVLGCGECEFCLKEQFSLCDCTNPSDDQIELLGGKTAGVLGYTHLTGGYPGCQAQYVRIPFADVNCLPLSSELPDEKVVFLSDVYPTAWHGNELGHVGPDSTVAVWGIGPIGLMAMVWARERGAKCILGIDCIPARLARAKALGFKVLNYDECDVKKAVPAAIPGGPSVCIECVGFDYCKSWTHSIEQTMKIESDSIDALSEAIYVCKKGGRVVVLGVFMGHANHFPIGALMEKGITVVGSQVLVQKYWNELYARIKTLDTSFLVSHRLSLKDAPHAYQIFNDKSDSAFKIVLKPWE